MGSAMACVARRRGHDVRLWGTWLDDAIVDVCERGELHPRLKLSLDRIQILRSGRLAEALAGSELVVHAVNSDGAIPVMTRAAPSLPAVPVLSVTKGLLASPRTGQMERIDVVLAETLGRPLRFVHAGGPAKAMELARGVLTWMQFAGAAEDTGLCAGAMADETLLVGQTEDRTGAELCSALKNAYATGLGLWDGAIGPDAHNARAAAFTQAIVEMRTLVVAAGGRAETVHGPAGVGDLHVTAAAGRNRAFGERVGRGKAARIVAQEMAAAGELTEGYPAIAAAFRFAEERGIGPVPFLRALHEIIWESADVRSVLAGLRWAV